MAEKSEHVRETPETSGDNPGCSSMDTDTTEADVWRCIDQEMDIVTKLFTEGHINSSQLTKKMNKIISQKTVRGNVSDAWKKEHGDKTTPVHFSSSSNQTRHPKHKEPKTKSLMNILGGKTGRWEPEVNSERANMQPVLKQSNSQKKSKRVKFALDDAGEEAMDNEEDVTKVGRGSEMTVLLATGTVSKMRTLFESQGPSVPHSDTAASPNQSQETDQD